MSNEKAICLLSLKMPIISLRCQAFKTKNIDPKGNYRKIVAMKSIVQLILDSWPICSLYSNVIPCYALEECVV